MNCEKIQQKILLNQAGELSEHEIEKLGKHLASCAACREYGRKTDEIMTLARTSLPSEGPDSAVIERILAAAREEIDHKTIHFQMPFIRFLYAAAAALVICAAGLWSFHSHPASSASQLSAIIMAMGSDENLHVISRSGKTERDQELQALASHLLIMEGFVMDEFPETEINDAADEPRPTVLRSHSIDVSEQQRCV